MPDEELHCPVCGHRGKLLYDNAKDLFFGVQGSWRVAQCASAACGMLWQAPTPRLEQLAGYYLNYYTHQAPVGAQAPATLKSRVRQAFYRRHYGYPYDGGLAGSLLSLLFEVLPVRRERLEHDVAYTQFVPGGRFLDVGCGAGNTLLRMRSLGWQVCGVDFDACAVKAAQELGLDVHAGSLEEQRLEGASFDVIIMEHLIEHVIDVDSLLRECRRLLKPGGVLIVMTPNAGALGHRLFREYWRGLEMPRHLRIYTSSALVSELVRAGFTHTACRTTALCARENFAQSAVALSKENSAAGLRKESAAVLCEWLERFAVAVGSHLGETLVAVARA